MKKNLLIVLAVLTTVVMSCSKDSTSATTTVDCATISAKFSTNVSPILNSKCGGTACHPANQPMFNYSDVKGHVDAGHFSEKVIVEKTMPPAGSTQLSTEEYNILKCWLDNGAQNN